MVSKNIIECEGSMYEIKKGRQVYMQNKVLIVEDDSDLKEGLDFSLSEEGYMVVAVETLKEAEKCFKNDVFDLILLDCNLPDGSGFELCKDIRKVSNIAILMLTARDGELDEVKALNLGVDDYMKKPFSLSVLKARIRNLLRRKSQNSLIESNGIRIDTNSNTIYKNENKIEVTAIEYRLLRYMVENKNQILSKEQILSHIWDVEDKYVDDNIVSVNIRRLRVKIEEEPSNPKFIKTIHGMGYLWKSK